MTAWHLPSKKWKILTFSFAPSTDHTRGVLMELSPGVGKTNCWHCPGEPGSTSITFGLELQQSNVITVGSIQSETEGSTKLLMNDTSYWNLSWSQNFSTWKATSPGSLSLVKSFWARITRISLSTRALKQWEAVMTCLSDINDPPHLWV